VAEKYTVFTYRLLPPRPTSVDSLVPWSFVSFSLLLDTGLDRIPLYSISVLVVSDAPAEE
jgi:hypothetical protein